MERTRFGIRFRISLLLLLATLNSVVMAAVSIVLFSTVTGGPSPKLVQAVPAIQFQLDRAQDAVLTGDMLDPVDRAGLDKALNEIQQRIEEVPGGMPSVESDHAAYASRVRAWQEIAARYHAGEAVDEGELAERLAEVRLAHRHLSASLQLSLVYVRPAWVESAVPFVPWAMAWILFVGSLTVVAAHGLRAQLSRPLASLADAARAVASGNLRVEIPATPGLAEISLLGDAIRAARDRLLVALAEQEGRSAREKAVFQHLGDGVAVCDQAGTVLQLNPRAEQILRLLVPSGDEPGPGLNLVRALPDIDPAVFASNGEADLEIVRSPPGQDQQVGARTWVELTLRGIPPGGTEGRTTVVVLRDVTTERELDQLQREFLSVVTHELKTPLTAIEGYARLLLRGKAGPLQGRQAEFVQTIADQSGVLKHMVQNLLDTSRIEGGTLPVHLQVLQMGGFMDEVLATWQGSASSRDVELVLSQEPGGGPAAQADPFRLHQVLGNLVGNALKFTPAGGRIELRARDLGAEILLEVEDNGRGIPAGKLDRIFDKFFQVARGDTRVAGGAGLGLYISKRLVEAMHGTLSVRSEEGRGSCFTIRLPAASPALLSAQPGPRTPAQETT